MTNEKKNAEHFLKSSPIELTISCTPQATQALRKQTKCEVHSKGSVYWRINLNFIAFSLDGKDNAR